MAAATDPAAPADAAPAAPITVGTVVELVDESTPDSKRYGLVVGVDPLKLVKLGDVHEYQLTVTPV